MGLDVRLAARLQEGGNPITAWKSAGVIGNEAAWKPLSRSFDTSGRSARTLSIVNGSWLFSNSGRGVKLSSSPSDSSIPIPTELT